MRFIVIHVTLCKICGHGGFSQGQSHIIMIVFTIMISVDAASKYHNRLPINAL